MKKFLLLMLVVWTGIASSCKYDDDELWGSVDDLANRISALETLTQQMNGDIVALQAIVTAVENQVAVSEVEKLTDGYILHFTNGQTATIKNGTDGQDGMDGENGQDGKDAPAIGIQKENGVYYWTLTVDGKTEWLTDEAGNKLLVTSSDGAAGADGSTGAAGAAGKTPTLKVDAEGYWMVSYDGTNFERVKDADDKDISALGQNGNTLFKAVNESSDKETIEIVMNDVSETIYKLPLLKAIEFYKDEACTQIADIKNIPWNGTSENVTYYCKLNIKGASHEVVDQAGINLVEVKDITSNEGETKTKVTLALSGNVVSDGRLVVLFFNETRTLTAVFKFIVAPWNGVSEAVSPENEVYNIATPANLKWIADQVNTGNSFANKTIKLLNDIDLAGKEWTPIGQNSNYPFEGTFDGNGKTVKGLAIGNSVVSRSLSRTGDSSEGGASSSVPLVKGAGLFGVVKNAILKGVTIKDAQVKTDDATGAAILVGCALGTVEIKDVAIEKEQSTSDVLGSENVGSLAGFVQGSDITIQGCSVTGTTLSTSTTDKTTSVGGVVGKLDMTVGANITISDNSVSDTQVSDDSAHKDSTQGAVVGNLSALDETVAGDIEEKNEVSEDVEVFTDVLIENTLFSQKLLELLGSDKVSLDENNYATISRSVVNGVTELDLGGMNKLTTLNGIEHFKNLRELNLQGSDALQSLDLSQNVNLESLSITYSQLVSLDLSKNTLLNHLTCFCNEKLESVNLGDNDKLTHLDAFGSIKLSNLTINKPEIMTHLNYHDTQLSYDLSKYTSITTLGCKNPSDFATLTDAVRSKIKILGCNDMGLATLDLSKYISLEHVSCAGNQMTQLILDNCTNLTSISCEYNKLTSLDLSDCTKLGTIYCHHNRLSELDLSKFESLDALECGMQTDKDNEVQVLSLKLNESLFERWYEYWKTNYDNNKYVKLLGNDGTAEGNDFEIGGIY